MRPIRLCSLTIAALLIATAALAQGRPNFAGTWKFDSDKSMQAGPGNHYVVAKMLGDEFTATQDDTTLTLIIKIGTAQVTAFYKLDGSESKNMSPEKGGDVAVISHCTWDAQKLVILSTSTSDVKSQPVTLETKRVLFLDTDGSLVMDRSGAPGSEITPSRSVYKRVTK